MRTEDQKDIRNLLQNSGYSGRVVTSVHTTSQRLVTPLRVAVALALGIFAAELGLRACNFAWPSARVRFVVMDPTEDARIRAGHSSFAFDADQLWVPREGAPIPGSDTENFGTDGLLEPVPNRARTAGVLRIAILGADATVAPHLPAHARWPSRMQSELAARGIACEVVDASVPLYSPRLGLERWRKVVREYKPDIVIAAYAMGNACKPAPMLRTDAKRLDAVRADPSLLQPWSAVGWTDRLRVAHAARWLWDVLFSSEYWDGRHAWFTMLRLQQTWMEVIWPGERRVMPDEFVDCLGVLAREIRAESALPLWVGLPPAPTAPAAAVRELYLRSMAQQAARDQVPFYDAHALFVVNEGVQLYTDEDTLNACGHDLLGLHVASQVAAMVSTAR